MASRVDSLYVGELTVGTTPSDLFGRVNSNAPTFINCDQYIAFIWTGVKSGGAPVQYTIHGGDARGWRWQRTGTIVANANEWFRVVIKPITRSEWYRIEVAGASQVLRSKIVGLKG
ncbi:MAG: hypothetical protein ABDI19_05990 [Armatimonadota bacterium]